VANNQMNDLKKFIPTRQSLLSRLKCGEDQESWKAFFDTYWRLIYSAALKAGLNDAEAQDVVQETVISVFKSMPGFQYNPQKGSFKSWLMRLTSWRITDQLRKRQKSIQSLMRGTQGSSTGTAEIDRLPDPAGLRLESAWSEEWEQTLMDAAIARVKKRVDSKHYQVFDLYVVKKWPVLKVARTLKVNPGKVYLIKHRIGNLIKSEIAYLQTKPI
jgi:RNA polymerase sigma factor (sigma-70 family)